MCRGCRPTSATTASCSSRTRSFRTSRSPTTSAYGLVNGKAKKAEIKARVEELLKLVGLPTSGRKYPSQLSGGQQQRVALARALATRPGLLLLDEPLSALDALERIRLRGEIRRLQRQVGITTIMVTHDQEEALSMADRIVVMNHGVIEQVGTPMDIYERPATPFVADFVGKVNVLHGYALGGNLLPRRRHGAAMRCLRQRLRAGRRGEPLPAAGRPPGREPRATTRRTG